MRQLIPRHMVGIVGKDEEDQWVRFRLPNGHIVKFNHDQATRISRILARWLGEKP